MTDELMDEPMIGVTEVSRRLGITPRTVRSGVLQGRVPAYRIAATGGSGRGQLRFKWSEIEAAMAVKEQGLCAGCYRRSHWSTWLAEQGGTAVCEKCLAAGRRLPGMPGRTLGEQQEEEA